MSPRVSSGDDATWWTLQIEGMRCDHCVRQVTEALQGVPGVGQVDVDLRQNQALVEASDTGNLTTLLEKAVEQVGFHVVSSSRMDGPRPATSTESDSSTESVTPAGSNAQVGSGGTSASGVSAATGGSPSATEGLPVLVELTPTTASVGGSASSIGATHKDAGGESAEAQTRLDIDGMHCASCVQRVESTLAAVPGVREVRVNLATEQATIESNASVQNDVLLAAVTRAGYRATLAAPPEEAADEMARRVRRETIAWRNRLIFAAVTLGLMIVVSRLSFLDATWRGWLQWLLATPLQLYVGWPYYRGAIARLIHLSASMDTLVALGTTAAYAAGTVGLLTGQVGMTFMDAGMILTFITLGRNLELRAKGRASAAIRRLLDLSPVEATVQREGTTVTLGVSKVGLGEKLIIRPGDKIPLDADVFEGAGHVDETWLTGESQPVVKKSGDRLFAGTINGEGSLRATVIRTSTQTALAQTIELVRRAQESKAPIQKMADRVVAWFVPVLLVVAGLTFVVWTAMGEIETGLACSVAVLVVACPCALGLATPTAMLVASGRGAEQGILIKNAEALERAGQLTTVVLDKTGTITRGKPVVRNVEPAEGVTEHELVARTAAVEQLSRHPLAAAVLDYAAGHDISVPPASQLTVRAGEGLEAIDDDGRLLVGNEDLLRTHGVSWPDDVDRRLSDARDKGQTALLVALNERFLGSLCVADAVAEGSRQAVAELRQLGLRLVMLSGDKRQTAEAIAAEVGMEEVLAEVKPADKQREVRRLQQSGEVVAMVGDGINDAPALAAADLGIAIGSGADVALETADIVVVRRHLELVPRAILLARRTRRTIRQNLGWAFIYNGLLIPVAAGVFIPWGIAMPPAWAAAAMAASSVSVVVNSLRLRRA